MKASQNLCRLTGNIRVARQRVRFETESSLFCGTMIHYAISRLPMLSAWCKRPVRMNLRVSQHENMMLTCEGFAIGTPFVQHNSCYLHDVLPGNYNFHPFGHESDACRQFRKF